MVEYKGLSHCFYVLESINSEDDENMRLLRFYRFYGDSTFRDKLLSLNIGLVKSQARYYFKYGNFDDDAIYNDFVQEGSIGFLHAVDRYDITQATKNGNKMKFSSYAVVWIKKKILEFIQNNSMTVRYTWRVLRAANKYKESIGDFYDEYGGLVVPFDHVIDASRSIRIGVTDLHNNKQYEDLEGVDIEDEEYEEEDSFQKLEECPLLDDAEKKFASAILNSKEKLSLNYNEKRILSNICDKLVVWRVKQPIK